MENKVNKIIWSKWQNPMAGKEDELESKELYFENEENEEDEDDEDGNIAVQDMGFFGRKIQPVVLTQFGMLPVKPFNNPVKQFNFWVGETNFDITQKVKDDIIGVDGVEVFDLFSRYRFRIAIGRAFDARTVMNAIDYKLIGEPAYLNSQQNVYCDQEFLEEISNARLKLSSYPYWIMLVLPNKTQRIFTPDSLKDFNKKKESIIAAKQITNGVIFTSDDQPQ